MPTDKTLSIIIYASPIPGIILTIFFPKSAISSNEFNTEPFNWSNVFFATLVNGSRVDSTKISIIFATEFDVSRTISCTSGSLVTSRNTIPFSRSRLINSSRSTLSISCIPIESIDNESIT